MQSEVDKDGWFEWKIIPGTLSTEDYKKIAKRFNATLPENFIEWHKRYFFSDGDCSIIWLPESLPVRPLKHIIDNLDWHIAQQLIPFGIVPFANEGNDSGPLVFDTRNAKNSNDFPIRVYDHDYGGDLHGLSEVVFSSFGKLIECLTHFLSETSRRKDFEVIPDF